MCIMLIHKNGVVANRMLCRALWTLDPSSVFLAGTNHVHFTSVLRRSMLTFRAVNYFLCGNLFVNFFHASC